MKDVNSINQHDLIDISITPVDYIPCLQVHMEYTTKKIYIRSIKLSFNKYKSIGTIKHSVTAIELN